MSEDGTFLGTPSVIKGGNILTLLMRGSKNPLELPLHFHFFGGVLSFSLTTLWRRLKELMKDVNDGVLLLPLLALLSTLLVLSSLYLRCLFRFPSPRLYLHFPYSYFPESITHVLSVLPSIRNISTYPNSDESRRTRKKIKIFWPDLSPRLISKV